MPAPKDKSSEAYKLWLQRLSASKLGRPKPPDFGYRVMCGWERKSYLAIYFALCSDMMFLSLRDIIYRAACYYGCNYDDIRGYVREWMRQQRITPLDVILWCYYFRTGITQDQLAKKIGQNYIFIETHLNRVRKCVPYGFAYAWWSRNMEDFGSGETRLGIQEKF